MQRLRQIRKEIRREKRPDQIPHPAHNQTLHIRPPLPFPPQRRHSQPYRIARVKLGSNEIDNDQAYWESGALDDSRDSGIALFETGEAGGGDDGEEASEGEKEGAIDILMKVS